MSISPILSNFQRGDIAPKVSPGAPGVSNLRHSMPEPGIQVCDVDVEPSPATVLCSAMQRAFSGKSPDTTIGMLDYEPGRRNLD